MSSSAIAHKEVSVKQIKQERLYTLREYLEREERSLHKHEYHQGKITRMAGGKAKHSEIATNIAHAIKTVIKPLPTKFRVYNSDLKIYIEPRDKSVYPDALVICKEPIYWEDREDLIVNPMLIVEVSSHSTKNYDRGDKFLLYELLPTFTEYLLVEQDFPFVETWYKRSPTLWEKCVETDMQKSITLNSLGISITLADVYENIVFKKK